MALPEGYQALFPEDAPCSLQDAVILRPWVSGGELLDLKLEADLDDIQGTDEEPGDEARR